MPDCKACKETRKAAEPVSFQAHESAMARMERANKRLWIVILVLLALLFGTNAGWLYFESQWEDVTVSQEVDTGNGSATVTGVGDINYGESQTDG